MTFVARAPITIPPGNQTWNLFNIVVLLLEYISAIKGLHAASTEPLAKPIKKDHIEDIEIGDIVENPESLFHKNDPGLENNDDIAEIQDREDY